jgi:hypothetical protein
MFRQTSLGLQASVGLEESMDRNFDEIMGPQQSTGFNTLLTRQISLGEDSIFSGFENFEGDSFAEQLEPGLQRVDSGFVVRRSQSIKQEPHGGV